MSRWRRLSDPKILIVAPLAGHFPTLLRGTVRDLLPDHEVYVTEWQDARFVPRADGPFDLDDYIDYIIEFHSLFPGKRACDGASASRPSRCFAAVSLMEADGRSAQCPRSMILMAGPIDARQNPTAVNRFAESPHARLVPPQRHHPGAVALSRHDATWSIRASSSSAASWA